MADADPQGALAFHSQSLTRPQLELMAAMQAGGAVAAIAARMGMVEHTVRNDLRSILRKLGIETLNELRALLD